MKKVLIAVDETEGPKSVLSVFHNMVSPPETVVLVQVQRLEGGSVMTDMLGETEMSTLRESLKGTEHKEALDRQSQKVLSYYKKEIDNGGLVSVKSVVRDGVPSEEIMRVAREEGVDLIITGCGGKAVMQRLVSGCVSSDLERGAPVPVLVVKDAAEEKHSWGGAKI